MPFTFIPELLLAVAGALGVPSFSSLFVNRLIKKEVDEFGPDPQEPVDSSGVPMGALERDFQRMLRKYYGHGLSAARINLTTSVSFSVLGGVVLLGGAGMAVWKAETSGEFYSAMVTSVAGLVMSVVATLFHRRADKALAHLTEQTRNLRADMAVERDARQAVALLDKVQNPALKAQLEAALILKFAQAEIPVLNGINLNEVPDFSGFEASVPAPASSN
ncbi:TRADD-N-associated membrane domain-containing protein [Streptomyces sp. NPDC002690]